MDSYMSASDLSSPPARLPGALLQCISIWERMGPGGTDEYDLTVDLASAPPPPRGKQGGGGLDEQEVLSRLRNNSEVTLAAARRSVTDKEEIYQCARRSQMERSLDTCHGYEARISPLIESAKDLPPPQAGAPSAPPAGAARVARPMGALEA